MDDVTIRSAASRTTKTAPAGSFTGTVLQDSMATPEAPSRTSATLVTFTPGRAHQLAHPQDPAGAGRHPGHRHGPGEGQAAPILRAGDVAEVPPGLVHWHGAIAAHLFAHISFIETDGPDNTTWMEPVDETHYQSVAVAPEA